MANIDDDDDDEDKEQQEEDEPDPPKRKMIATLKVNVAFTPFCSVTTSETRRCLRC